MHAWRRSRRISPGFARPPCGAPVRAWLRPAARHRSRSRRGCASAPGTEPCPHRSGGGLRAIPQANTAWSGSARICSIRPQQASAPKPPRAGQTKTRHSEPSRKPRRPTEPTTVREHRDQPIGARRRSDLARLSGSWRPVLTDTEQPFGCQPARMLSAGTASRCCWPRLTCRPGCATSSRTISSPAIWAAPSTTSGDRPRIM